MSDYDLIPQGTEHVEAPYVPEPDGEIFLPEGTEHVALIPAAVGVVDVPKKKTGRRYAFTAKKQKKYLRRIRAGDGRDLAARNAGVSPTTVRSHRRAFPEYEDKIIAAESEANGLIERAAVQTALDGNATMQIFLLTNRMPEKYTDRRSPRVLQQINAGAPSVEWSLQEARAEAFGIVDDLEAKRIEKERKASGAIDATSSEADGG